MQQKKRILVCPLDWGLGHATRCIPIIRLLLKKNLEVIIAADNRPLELLKLEFPNLEFIRFKGYDIQYPDSGSMILKMILSSPAILKGIKKEHHELKKIIRDKKIDVVISDNRFGCWNKKIKSIFITHQLMIKSPIAENLLRLINWGFIKKYDECWIPDEEGEPNLSADLSHKYTLPKNTFFIGVLSRFENSKASSNIICDVMAIISGPEPQRSVFEDLVLEQLSKSNLKAIVVRGITESVQTKEIKNNVEIFSHLNATEMEKAILSSKIIIARSGYSTIMDLATLGKKAVFVATPGQTEQEYLAEELMKKKIVYSQHQNEMDLKKALIESENYLGFAKMEKNNFLKKRIDILISV